MVLKELLGPGSPEEEIIESPGTRYFVGVLAPRKRAKAGAAAATSAVVPPPPTEDEEETDGEILDGDELALGGRDTTQDGTTDQAPAQDKALIPSSFGMTFSLNLEAKELQLSAAWGQYVKEDSEYLVSEKTGSPRRVWKRYPRGGKHRLKLVEGPIQPIAVDHNCPEVVVQGLIRKRSDHWCVTLFLVNEQQEPERLKDTAWVFQPELMAEGVDGAAVIHKRHTVLELSGTDPAVKAENDLLAMLYRRHVEFAVGHGIGVHVDVSPDPNHAVRCPHQGRAELRDSPHDTAPARRCRDQSGLRQAGGPGPRHEARWPRPTRSSTARSSSRCSMPTRTGSTGKRSGSPIPPRDWRPSSTSPSKRLHRCRTTLKRIEAGLDLLDKDDKAAQAFQFMNRAMWLQRTHSIFAERVRRGDEKPDFATDRHPRESLVVSVPACLHPAEPAGDHEVRSPRTQRKPRTPWPTCSGSPRAAERPKPTWA